MEDQLGRWLGDANVMAHLRWKHSMMGSPRGKEVSPSLGIGWSQGHESLCFGRGGRVRPGRKGNKVPRCIMYCCMMKPYIKDGKCAISRPMHTSVCIGILRAPLDITTTK